MTRVPTLNLNQLLEFHQQAQGARVLCHVFGLFLEEKLTNNSNGATLWILSDESHLPGVEVKLLGEIDTYPQPEPGDVVRIHRLAFDVNTKQPTVLNPKNVVLWRAFKYLPNAVTTARNPTINQDDDKRRRILETFYSSILSRISELPNKTYSNDKFSRVCGRVESTSFDHYGNLKINMSDGSGTFELRVFPKRLSFETDDHFKLASTLKSGDYIVVAAAKLNSTNTILDLSANKRLGRSLRIVEKESMLGIKISEYLQVPQPQADLISEASNSNGPESPQHQAGGSNRGTRIVTNNQVTNVPLRRSPRLNSTNTFNNPQTTPVNGVTPENLQFKQVCDLRQKDGYDFFDFAGQVRGTPNVTRQFGHYVIQLYDGSKPAFPSFYLDEVKSPVDNCVTVIFYKPERPTDTDEHIRTVLSLKDGDFVVIKNVKVSFRNGKLRLEMSSNKSHNKSIKVIDNDSSLGRALMNKIMFRPLEEALLDPSELSSLESTGPID